MSTAKRRRGQSLQLDLPNGQQEDVPAIAALFLVTFDSKTGLAGIMSARSQPSDHASGTR